jgi:hypothetical protein
MNTGMFKLIKNWLRSELGLELTPLVWVITLLIPVGKYMKITGDWLKDHLTNSVSLSQHDSLGQDILAWVADQPTNTLFSWLPTFRHLEWTQISFQNKRYEKMKEKTKAEPYELAATKGKSFFFFQGIPFVLEHAEDNYKNVQLRCFWPNPRPITSLIKHVQQDNSDKMLCIRQVRGKKVET